MRAERPVLAPALAPVLALGAAFVAGSLVGAQPERLGVAAPDVVWLDGGAFLRGSRDDDLRYAVELCEREWGLRGDEICRGGAFTQLFAAEAPARRIFVGPYGIDRHEVTRARWRRCVLADRCPPARIPDDDPRLGGDRMPVTGVTWREASAFCAFAGGRLPTEAEWERAARGPDDRRFPWGDVYNDRLANHAGAIDGHRYLAPVGAYPDGASPHGLLDVAGNVWEWTADRFEMGGYASGLDVDPRGPRSGGERVTRGGSWATRAEMLRVTMRRPVAEGESAPDLGFRCAYDPPEPGARSARRRE